MPSNSKTVILYLVDGVAGGITTVQISHRWSGKMYVIPKSRVAELKDDSQLLGSGTYLLVGDDPNDPSKDRIYVGQSDTISRRLSEHIRSEPFDWSRAVVIVSTDFSINTAHTLWLEKRLFEVVSEKGRSTLDQATPRGSNLSVHDIADMEYYIEQLHLLLPVVGIHVLEDQPHVIVQRAGANGGLALRLNGGDARAVVIDDRFVVLQGSNARADTAPTATYRGLRQRLIDEGRLVPVPGDDTRLSFSSDTEFSSASAAAVVCLGYSANGRDVWVLEGTTESYGAYLSRQQPRESEEPATSTPDFNGEIVATQP